MGDVVNIGRAKVNKKAKSPGRSWCWLGIHTWLPWVDVAEGDILRDGDRKGRYVRQEQRCMHCNKLKLRMQTTELDN